MQRIITMEKQHQALSVLPAVEQPEPQQPVPTAAEYGVEQQTVTKV